MLLKNNYWKFLLISFLVTDRRLVEILSLHRKWKNGRNKNNQTFKIVLGKIDCSWKCKILILLVVLDFDVFGFFFSNFWFDIFNALVFVIWGIKTSSNLSIEEGILSYDVTKPIPAPGVIRIGFGMNFSVFCTWCPKLNVSFVRRTNLHIGSKFSHSMEKNDRHFTRSLRGIVWAGLVEKKTVDFLF